MGRPTAKKTAKRKARLKKRADKANRPRKPRTCGSCGACCVTFPVRGLPGYEGVKPSGEPCKHLKPSEAGCCGIHLDRPPVCRIYECLWIHDGRAKNRKLRQEWKPDAIGVIFDLTDKKHVATKALGRPVVVAREGREGAFGEVEALDVFERMMDQGDVIVKIIGKGRDKHYEYIARKQEDAEKVAKAYENIKHFKVIRE
jgi:Fe-S-cluster containining protein